MVLKDFSNRMNEISVELKLFDMDKKKRIRTGNGKLFLNVTLHLWKTVEKLLLYYWQCHNEISDFLVTWKKLQLEPTLLEHLLSCKTHY